MATVAEAVPTAQAHEAADALVATALAMQANPDARSADLMSLAGKLEDARRYRYARLLLARARTLPGMERDAKLAQRFARCTYKDADLPAGERFDRALQVLDGLEPPLASTRDQETLGLAGSCYKRKWEVEGQRAFLERALYFYLRGYREGVEGDLGYTAVNAAFCLDLLARIEAEEGERMAVATPGSPDRREQAALIRRDVVTRLSALPAAERKPEGQWWFLSTLAEAELGLGQYEEAGSWLRATGKLAVGDWVREGTTRQLAQLMRLREQAHDPRAEEGWQVLREFLGQDVTALRSAATGKVGLALSGGGFRASLYHIGVLARLAEADLLRHVEVLSCVSGGSILGAYYYLEIRKLLRQKDDGEITRDDYVALVARMERDFLAGVQRDIRSRILAQPAALLQTLWHGFAMPTRRAAELYEREIYSLVKDGHGRQPRWLDGLFIHPKGAADDFTPNRDNWRRAAKAPVLVLNATTLNTGHNWQFTASWMGEPPPGGDDTDGNERLRRMYYGEAPPTYTHMRLGHAVAASACVPALFQPLALDGLYPERKIRLVDGGVHDNQGIASLLEQDCAVIIVSDASGQMTDRRGAGRGPLSTPFRSNSILMARVREAQIADLWARRRAGLLRDVAVVHLRKGLPPATVDWVECQEPRDPFEELEGAGATGPLTSFGIRRDLQALLAGVRTDLDSFCDVEAYALMLSGYRMMDEALRNGLAGLRCADGRAPWRFMALDHALSTEAPEDPEPRRIQRILLVASSRAAKVWRLRPFAATGTLVGIVGVLAALGWLLRATGSWKELLSYLPVTAWQRWGLYVLAGIVVLSGVAWVHGRVFDRLYLRYGRVEPDLTPAASK